jgi:hypothetical protein
MSLWVFFLFHHQDLHCFLTHTTLMPQHLAMGKDRLALQMWKDLRTIHKSLWEFFLFHQHWQLLSLSSSSCVFTPSLLLLAIAACDMLRVEALS